MKQLRNPTSSPGLLLERRSFVALASSALLGFALRPRRSFAELVDEAVNTPEDGVGLEQFLEEVVPVARRLVGDTSRRGQDRYLRAIAAEACRLADLPLPEYRPSGQGEGAWIGFHPGGDPFTVLHWKLEPGAHIRPHAHTYGNVVTVGLAGICRVWNWEVSGENHTDPERSVEVVCTHAQRLAPGDTNLVSLRRHWCHGFEAGSRGARGLDLTTRLHERQPTPYLDLEPGQGRQVGQVTQTRWVFDGKG